MVVSREEYDRVTLPDQGADSRTVAERVLMTSLDWILTCVGILATFGVVGVIRLLIHKRNMQYWLGSYYFPSERHEPIDREQPVDLFVAICDHWEPECYGASREKAMERVQRWVYEYPIAFDKFRDFNGRPPQHTFFFPQDEYRPEYLDEIAQLCAEGGDELLVVSNPPEGGED